MMRTVRHTSFTATDGNKTLEITVCGALSEGKARSYAAKELGVPRTKVVLTTPLVITSATYEMTDSDFVKYGSLITPKV